MAKKKVYVTKKMAQECELYQVTTRRGHCAGVFVDQNGIVVGGASVFRAFIGQPLVHLAHWYQVLAIERLEQLTLW